MPGSAYNQQFGSFYGDELVALVKNGSIPEDRLDDMVLRTLTPVLEYQNLTTYPQPSFDVRDLLLRRTTTPLSSCMFRVRSSLRSGSTIRM